MEEKKIRIGIGLPVATTIPAASFANFLEVLGYTASKYDTIYAVKVNTLVDAARNAIAKELLKSKVDYIWFIDSDMVMTKNAIDFLMNAIQHGDAATGLYFSKERKNGKHIPIAATLSPDGEAYFIGQYPKNSMTLIDAAGFGCMLLKAEVFDKIEYPWFETKWQKKVIEGIVDGKPYRNEEWYQIGEDIMFCRKMKEKGMKIVLHTGLVCGHVGGIIDDKNSFIKGVHLRKKTQ